MYLGDISSSREPNAQLDIPGQVLTGIGQMLDAAAHKQARRKKRAAGDPWQQKGAHTAISSFFELLRAYPGGVTPAMLQTHCLDDLQAQLHEPAPASPGSCQADKRQEFCIGEAVPCCQGAEALRLQSANPGQPSATWILHSGLADEGYRRQWLGARVRVAAMEGLPCIHKPEKVARKAPTPEFLIPGQCFVLIAQSLQEARSMAAVPAHAALQESMHDLSHAPRGNTGLHLTARVAPTPPAPVYEATSSGPPCIVLQPLRAAMPHGMTQQGGEQRSHFRLQLSWDQAGLAALLAPGEHVLISHVQPAEHPTWGPCMQMTPQSCIVCISAPPAPPALPSRSPLGAISTQSASHSPDSSHPLARGKENRPAGWCAAAATGKLQQPTSLVSHCQLGKHLDKGGHAPEQRMLGPASAGLLIGTLVGSRRGAAAGQAELRLQAVSHPQDVHALHAHVYRLFEALRARGAKDHAGMPAIIYATTRNPEAAQVLLSLRPGHCVALTGLQPSPVTGACSSQQPSYAWEQGRGALMCNLSTLPALLTSPMFCSTAAPLASVLEQGSAARPQQLLVTGTICHAPEVRVQRVHSACGRPVVEASLGLEDLFDDEDFDMCSNACPAPDPAANLGCSSLWTCSSCQMDCGQAATALVFTGNLMQGACTVQLDSLAIQGILRSPAAVYDTLSQARQEAQRQGCMDRLYAAALYWNLSETGTGHSPAFSNLVMHV